MSTATIGNGGEQAQAGLFVQEELQTGSPVLEPASSGAQRG